MSELIPKGIPKGKDLLREGVELGNTFAVGKSAFLRYRGIDREDDWKRKQAEAGRIQWDLLLGLSTFDEQVEALGHLWEWGKTRGIEIDRVGHIGSMLNGLPPEMRRGVPRPTSFLMEHPDDAVRLAQAAPVQSHTDDHAMGSPNAVENVMNWLKAGCCTVGNIGQHVWDYPYWRKDVEQEIQTVKALGMMASKRDSGAIVGSYVGDGIPSQFLDHASEVGYMMLERYIVDDLCGAAYAVGTGGVHAHIPAKLATWLALFDVLRSKDHCPVLWLEGNTLEPTEDFAANYALVVAEFIPFAILERKYKTGTAYRPKPVTECVRVPTLTEILDVLAVCDASLKKVREFEETNLIDDRWIAEKSSLLAEEGREFFANCLKALSDMGVDIKDPLQLLLAVRRLGGAKLEELAHPGPREPERFRGIVPFLQTDLFKKPLEELDKAVTLIKAERLGDGVRDKKIIIGSTDTHEFGLFVLERVLRSFGATVINGGVDLEAEAVLDLASRESTPYVSMSTHNGLCLEWGERLFFEAKRRNQRVRLFMGGILNTVLEDNPEPVDVSDRLRDLGITPCKKVVDLFRAFAGSTEG